MNFVRRVLRSIFTWKTAGRLLFALACLVTLAALLVIEENWRGKHDWEAFAREHEARGDSLGLKAYLPPEVPDDQNFAMTPLLAPIYKDEDDKLTPGAYSRKLQDKLEFPKVMGQAAPKLGDRATGKYIDIDAWKDYLGADVLGWLKKLDPELREISEASRRPYSRFPVAYEKGMAANFWHLTILIDLSKLYTLRACAELHEEQTDAALADAQTIFRLCESIKNEPFLVSHLVQSVILQNGMQVVWEGLDEHRWTDAQLQALQGEIARADILDGLELAFHGERAACNELVLSAIANPEILPALLGSNPSEVGDNIYRFVPSGLIYQNLLEINRFYEKYAFNSVNPAAHRVYPDILKEAEQSIMDVRVNWRIYKFLEAIDMPVSNWVISKMAYEQTMADQALIACALERYRLANEEFPDALVKLVPTYLKEIPPDVVDGKPPHYRLNKDGTFLLYSDGWDGKDHGGKVIVNPKKGTIDVMKGDWVWTGVPE